MAVRRVTSSSVLAVSLDEAKQHLNIDHSDSDDLLTLFIKAATEHCEEFQGRAFCDQEWEVVLDAFPANEIKLARPPLLEVVSVRYDDTDGVEQVVDPALYTVDSVNEPGWVLPAQAWPSTFAGVNAVRVRFRAGYVDASSSPADGNVPADTKAAILMTVGTLYNNRETIVIGQTAVMLPWAAEQLLRRKRFDLSLA